MLVPAGALAGLSAAQMEALLVHELAHIRRHDYLVNIFQSMIEAVFFYHPAVWWISSHMRAERELCCDDVAVSVTGDAVTYARTLAEFEFDSAHWLEPAVMAANGGSLAYRIARLLGQTSTPGRASSGTATAPALILLAMGAGAVFAFNPPSGPDFEVAAAVSCIPQPEGHERAPAASRAILPLDATLPILIQYAKYGVAPFQVVGGPNGLISSRYQIDARADAAASRDQMFLMLQSLLEDRFQLKTHRDMKELPVFALVPNKGAASGCRHRKKACVRGCRRDPLAGLARWWKNGATRAGSVGQASMWLRGCRPGVSGRTDKGWKDCHAGVGANSVHAARPECDRPD